MCAADSLSGPIIVAYADTLIRTNLTLDPEADVMIWVKKVSNQTYGVVKLNKINYFFSNLKNLFQLGSDWDILL